MTIRITSALAALMFFCLGLFGWLGNDGLSHFAIVLNRMYGALAWLMALVAGAIAALPSSR